MRMHCIDNYYRSNSTDFMEVFVMTTSIKMLKVTKINHELS